MDDPRRRPDDESERDLLRLVVELLWDLNTQGQPLSLRLLAAPRPTLAAMEAASDLDHLYAAMLLANKNYGWARLAFQKNVSRWKYWRPQTPDTARRLKAA